MRHTILKKAAIGLAAVLALSGCSAGGTSGDGSVTLQMVESLTNPARTQILKKLIAGFEKENPKITVQLISPPTDQADQKIQQMLQSGKGVDVLEVRDLTAGSFISNGWIYDMSADLKGWAGWNDLTDAAKNIADDKGKSYFIPYGFYGLTLFYRTDLVKDAGFSEAPKSWDDLLEQALKINDPAKNVFGYAFRGGPNANGMVTAMIEAYVADDLDAANAMKLKDGKSIFSSPKAKEALATYLKLFKNGSPPSAVAWGYPEMVQSFTSGSTAFLLQDPEVIATVRESTVLKDNQWGTAPLLTGPTGKAAQPLATAGWGVAKGSEHKKEAVKFIEYLSSGDASTTFAKGNSLVPIAKSAADDPFFKTGPWASYVTMTQHPESYLPVNQRRDVPWWTEWFQKSDSEFQSVLTGQLSPNDMLAGWDKYWTEKWKTAG